MRDTSFLGLPLGRAGNVRTCNHATSESIGKYELHLELSAAFTDHQKLAECTLIQPEKFSFGLEYS